MKKAILVVFFLFVSLTSFSFAEVKENTVIKKQTETNYVFRKFAKAMGIVVFSGFMLYSVLKIVKNVKSLKEPANIIEKTKRTETMLSNAKDMDEALNNFIIRTKDTI